ncbi:MAG: SDR family NAD(P)-dependent oxidoreductase, partial [bacterium]
MTMKDKVAVVTGAGRGIGREIALAFAREGAKLAINSMHEETINPVAEELRALGAEVLPLVLDISKEDEVERYVKEVYDKFGRCDILVNNAGMNKDNFFLRLSAEDWDAVIAVNLRGSFLCTRLFSRRMIRSKWGRIINMASVAGEA